MRFFKCATLCLGLTALLASAYIVKEGDTLWDLSDEFLHDPFAWPDLWENNRHIQDPHWIYPGDSIYFGDSIRDEQVLQVPGGKNPCRTAVADSNLPKGVSAVGCDDADARDGDFENMLGDLRNRDKKKKKSKPTDSYYYTQRPAPKIFNGYYQMHAPIIYTIDSLKKDSSFFTIRSGEKKEPLIHLPESEVVVGIGKKTSIKAKKGDLVEIFDARAIDVPAAKGKSFDKFALLRISGIAKITAVGDTLSRAQIVQSFRDIRINQSKARLKQPLQSINVTGYKTVKEAQIDSMAIIRYAMDPMLIIGAYSYVLIDKGSAQNYNSGDAVAVWEKDLSDATIPPRLLGRGIIVRAAENESAVLIREIYSNNRRIEMGHKVSVTHSATVSK
ncbi:LysM peptidoglycan-binding domain-containing protein [Fibrobacter sp. UBA4309]|uniref:LysM peptidoglycan-binding domain-containing protein n=1 Tax=Fibrobacter sp. UBA4309 TaxID=1946537 RepID=UPI0025BE170F|nr:LysM peptidoglycan-binding domain-containing protein [Fibrobacter sp. UBA4309]